MAQDGPEDLGGPDDVSRPEEPQQPAAAAQPDAAAPEQPDAGSKEATLALVRKFLGEHGAASDEIERAEAANVLDLLATDRLLVPARGMYTIDDVSQLTGMEADVLRSFWRALGFADVEPSDQAFTDLDVDAIVLLKSMIDLGVTDVEHAVHMTRVIGASMARIADAIMAPVTAGPSNTPNAADGTQDGSADADRFTTQHAIAVPITAKLLEFAWRRHAQAAVRRAMLVRLRGDAALPDLCVGFADMVGFTEISQQLSEDELARMVARFEEVAHDTVTARGGRLVKMIGDEAMFVADTALDGALIATSLAEAYAEDEMLADVRVSLAFGSVLLQDGDYFGPTVNLASRSVGIARPGSVIVTSSFRDALSTELGSLGELRDLETGSPKLSEDESGFVLRALRPRRLKGLGWVPLWVLRRQGAKEGSPEARASNRWERLAQVLKDLDDVREKGERLLAGDTGVLSAPGLSASGLSAPGLAASGPSAPEVSASGLGDPERRDAEGP
ncbi:MAG: adenylate cyclase regulatory domain-containing protein [Acidimicrobiales bacterium]